MAETPCIKLVQNSQELASSLRSYYIVHLNCINIFSFIVVFLLHVVCV